MHFALEMVHAVPHCIGYAQQHRYTDRRVAAVLSSVSVAVVIQALLGTPVVKRIELYRHDNNARRRIAVCCGPCWSSAEHSSRRR